MGKINTNDINTLIMLLKRRLNRIEQVFLGFLGLGGAFLFFRLGGGTFVSDLFRPKSIPESVALLEKVDEVRSKTIVGMNYRDYLQEAQELQVLKDKFEKAPKSKRLKYVGNLLAISDHLIDASNKESGEDWSPNPSWSSATFLYSTLESCQNKGDDCFDTETEANIKAVEYSLQRFSDLYGSDE